MTYTRQTSNVKYYPRGRSTYVVSCFHLSCPTLSLRGNNEHQAVGEMDVRSARASIEGTSRVEGDGGREIGKEVDLPLG